MGWVEVPQAPRERPGDGVFLSPLGRVWDGVCPSTENFSYFFVENAIF